MSLPMCGRCGKALPCFSIEWSNLPDGSKCKCGPLAVAPDSPLVNFIRFLFGVKKV